VLHVHTRCLDLRGARFRYEYAIAHDDGTPAADGYTEHACVDAATLRPTRVPAWLVEAIRTAEASFARASSPSTS
jgi:acyl-CoA thioesterase FadM